MSGGRASEAAASTSTALEKDSAGVSVCASETEETKAPGASVAGESSTALSSVAVIGSVMVVSFRILVVSAMSTPFYPSGRIALWLLPPDRSLQKIGMAIYISYVFLRLLGGKDGLFGKSA